MSDGCEKANEELLDSFCKEKEAIDDLLTKLKKQRFAAGMTDSQYKAYFQDVRVLDSVVRRIKKDAEHRLSPSEILTFASLLMTYAFAVGTYKYPDEIGRTHSVFGFFAKGRSNEMSADEAAALEKNDQQFAKRTCELRARGMREKLAQTRKPAEEALMAAIKSVRGDGASDNAWAESGRILVPVNKELGRSKQAPVSKDVIYRRLKKLPRS